MFLKSDGELKSSYRNVKRNGKTVRLHRWVLRQKTGEDPKGVIHHKNGDKLDNSPDNLEVVPSQSEHIRLHATIDKRRIKPRPCAVCGKMFKPITDCGTKYVACSVSCGAEYRASISVDDVLGAERRRLTGEKLGDILSGLGIKRKSYEQRRRSLRRRGLI